jgi:hypothetical protein
LLGARSRVVAVAILAATALVSAGCGTSSPSKGGSGNPDAAGTSCGAFASATVNGTLQGNSFNAKDAVSYSGDIAIVDFAGLCAFGLANGKSNATYLYFSFSSGSFPLGTTDVGSALDVRAVVDDQACNSAATVSNSGSLTLTQVDSCDVAGTFDVMIETDHLTGSFTALSCTMPGDGGCN